MKYSQSTMSAKNQIVVPSNIRNTLGLKAGDSLNWKIVMSDKAKSPKVIAEPTPKSWAKHTRGLGQELWSKVDIDSYINNLRREWQSQD